MRSSLATFALLLAALAAAGAHAAAAPAHRFALFVGEQEGGDDTRPLRYAERDARRMHAILTRLGSVKAEDARLLLSVDDGTFRAALDETLAKVAQAKARGEATWLLVYYSGHSKDGDLRLRDGGRVPMAEVRKKLEAARADVRIGLFDSCQSGAITRGKGARAVPAFDVQKAREASEGPKGLVLIASSAADEESQESDEINASFFTHYLATGLLGDADTSGDGKVTLAEAYAYAYGRTVGSTMGTVAGAQHPVYLYDLGGAGDVVLTEPGTSKGSLVFAPQQEGLYVVLDGGKRAIAEVAKARGEQKRLSLAAGTYTIKKRDDAGLRVGEVKVSDGPVELDDARLTPRALTDDPQKGAFGATFSLLFTVGRQVFFDKAARDGLFPPSTLLGLELAARGDLGHKLAWGFDLGLGGGDGTLHISELDPTPVKFGELSGGASLWRDLRLGPLDASLGARVAFILLARSFPQRADLPQQSFFTLTPGLTAGLTWSFAPSWSLVGRARVNYLFYSVDKNQSLGYAEFSLGVDHAFGD
jgi:Caspase domain